MKKIAILGASYLQRPLVEKAKEMGLKTHVFAWRDGNVVEDICNYYYDISILDKEKILAKCKEIGIDGIISIASDIAMPTVNYVANELNLVGNPLETTLKTTDKFEMRKALQEASIPCPKFDLHTDVASVDINSYNYPVIVKPTDRSGSRGVTKVESPSKLIPAINKALENSINKRAIVEEFIEGREFSVEAISYKGKHKVLAITDKVTTGAPYFVEIAHHQPAQISKVIELRIIELTEQVLTGLKIENGANHTELFLTKDGELRVVETAGRMGGDFIGSTLTSLTSGVDTLKAVIDICLSKKPDLDINLKKFAGILFLSKETEWLIPYFENACSLIIKKEQFNHQLKTLESSQDRSGYLIYESNKRKFDLKKYKENL